MSCEQCKEPDKLVINDTISHPYHDCHVIENLPDGHELWIKNKYGRVAAIIRFDSLGHLQELLRVEVARHQDVLVTQSHEHTLEGQVNQTSGADSIAAPGKIF